MSGINLDASSKRKQVLTHRTSQFPANGSTCAMRSSGIASPGFWFLGSLLCLSFAASMVADDKGTSANLSICLTISKRLIKETRESLNQFQKEFNCTLKSLFIDNPGNEDKIKSKCITGQSKPGPSFSGENHADNQTLCMETIHSILASYEEKLIYSKSFGSTKLLDTVNDMMQALKINNKTIEEASSKPSGSYSSRMQQCKFLLIFKQLSETIDRNLNYRNSPGLFPKC